MKLSNKFFIKTELILIMLYIISLIIIELLPKTNIGSATFTFEILAAFIIAIFAMLVSSAIIILFLIMIIYNIEQIYKRKDLNKLVKYALIISLIMIEASIILFFFLQYITKKA